MGGGGLLQLVAYGAQDVFLTGNPQITFFKLLYRRHTNFAIESIEQTFVGGTPFGGRPQVVISRNGDLLHKVYLQCTLPKSENNEAYVNKLGFRLLQEVEVEIGGQKIDRTYGRWMDLWHSFTHRSEKDAGFAEMALVDHSLAPDQGFHLEEERTMYVPINFWFSKGSAGAALPLIALQYHEVKLIFNLAQYGDLVKKSSVAPTSAVEGQNGTRVVTLGGTAADPDAPSGGWKLQLFADFIFLDTAERRRFAQTSHEYLIEQLQTTGPDPQAARSAHTIRLAFNHPCKAFYWCFVPDDAETGFDASGGTVRLDPFFNGSSQDLVKDSAYKSAANPIAAVKLQLNGHERFAERPGTYFQLTQAYQHHTRVPTTSFAGLYSFCISPEEHQPSGALNMSRVDNAQIQFQMSEKSKGQKGSFFIYAVNYNVLRILSGMGGLAFSN